MSCNTRRLRAAALAIALVGGLALGGCSTSAAGKDPTASGRGSTSAVPTGDAHSSHSGSTSSAPPEGSSPAPVGSSSGPAAPADSDTAGACAALITVDSVQPPGGGPDGPPSADELKQFGKTVLPALHEAIAKGGTELAASLKVLEPVAEAAAKDGAPIPDDEKVNGAVAAFHTWAHQNCGYQNLDVSAVDYKFEGIPATLKSGPTSIAMTNHSAKGEFHVALIVKAKDPKITTVDQLLAIPMPEMEAGMDMLGAVAVPPGASSGVLLDLGPGRYFVICPVPVGGDENSDDVHMMHGMATAFDVA